MAPIMNKEQIKQIIPHRDPFLLIDEIIKIDEGKKINAIKQINEDEFWFKGHFPDYPVVPGVLIIEMLAQACAVLVFSIKEYSGKIGFITGIDKAAFRRQVFPGETLTLDVEIIKLIGPIGTGIGTALVDGQIAATAEISFYLQ